MQDQRDPTIRDAVDMLSDDETLLPDRAHKALRVGVGIRRPDGRPHDPHARAFVTVVRPDAGIPAWL